MCNIIWMSPQSRFIVLSDPIIHMCRSGPGLPGNGSVMITGAGEGGNSEVRLCDCYSDKNTQQQFNSTPGFQDNYTVTGHLIKYGSLLRVIVMK